ncbi:MAG: TylF/MycF/NovP-related O-methyltransferase [Candidatus Hodarchaeota archaeon]
MQNKIQDCCTKPYQLAPQGFFNTVRVALKRYGFTGSLARYLMMQDEFRKFVKSVDFDNEKAFRKDLLRKFNLIQKKVPCLHSPYQFVLIATFILKLTIEGPIVQCGCFKGGSTAKLSLLAERTKRLLYVCDSFKGLPAPRDDKESFLEGHNDSPNLALSVGEYEGTLKEVKENIKRYGCIEVCEFIPGLFSESLIALDVNPSFVFIDVDFASSARDCLKYLWPRLVPGGYWFTHEAGFPQYIYSILDPEWWHNALRECPPVIMGGGSGLSSISEYLAYFKKVPK